jgi:Enoyl-(Acyl carrier protein) reductase
LTFAGDAADGRLLERAVAETVDHFGALHRLVVVAENSRVLAKRYGVSMERARYEYVHREFGMSVAPDRAGRHDEIADLIVYLLSARASYITGATVNVDGGTDF